MKKINEKDKKLIEAAFQQLERNSDYDNSPFSNKASVVLGESGKIYGGINLSLWYGACSEVIAIGNALANGERKLVTIAAAGKDAKGVSQIIVPCGNCRQLMAKHCPNIDIIIFNGKDFVKVKPSELLPYQFVPTSK